MTDATVRLLLSIDFLALGIWLGSGVYFHAAIRPSLSHSQSLSDTLWNWPALLHPVKRLLILQFVMGLVLLGTSVSRTVMLSFPWYYSVPKTLLFGIRVAMFAGVIALSTWIIPRLSRWVEHAADGSKSGPKDHKRIAQFGRLFLLLDLTALTLCSLSIVLLVEFG